MQAGDHLKTSVILQFCPFALLSIKQTTTSDHGTIFLRTNRCCSRIESTKCSFIHSSIRYALLSFVLRNVSLCRINMSDSFMYIYVFVNTVHGIHTSVSKWKPSTIEHPFWWMIKFSIGHLSAKLLVLCYPRIYRIAIPSIKVPDHPAEHDMLMANPNQRCERWQFIQLPLNPTKVIAGCSKCFPSTRAL